MGIDEGIDINREVRQFFTLGMTCSIHYWERPQLAILMVRVN